jgi:hypothetical protein
MLLCWSSYQIVDDIAQKKDEKISDHQQMSEKKIK